MNEAKVCNHTTKRYTIWDDGNEQCVSVSWGRVIPMSHVRETWQEDCGIVASGNEQSRRRARLLEWPGSGTAEYADTGMTGIGTGHGWIRPFYFAGAT